MLTFACKLLIMSFLQVAAHSCPLQNGDAVFIARQILNNKWGYRTYDDVDLCRPVALRSFAFEPLEHDRFTVYPNPARDRITAYFPTLEEADKITFTVADMYGKIFEPNVISASPTGTEIDITGLPSGMYVCKAWRNGVYRAAKMVFIVR